MIYYTKKALYDKVSTLKNQLQLPQECSYPLNAIALCRQAASIEMEAVPFRSKYLRGMAVVAEHESQNDVILLNSYRSHKEQNFDCAHELMHLFLHRDAVGKQFNCYDKIMPNQDSFLEWQANEGAAEFLLPYWHFIPEVVSSYKKALETYRFKDFLYFNSKLAQQYGVTTQVIAYRMGSLAYEIHQHLNGIPIADIQILSQSQQKNLDMHVVPLHTIIQEKMQSLDLRGTHANVDLDADVHFLEKSRS